VILGLAVSFLLRALRWLREMGRALAQARREMRRGRFGCVWAANLCRRDALTFGRLAGQDLLLWRELRRRPRGLRRWRDLGSAATHFRRTAQGQAAG